MMGMCSERGRHCRAQKEGREKTCLSEREKEGVMNINEWQTQEYKH